jgi:hypothetical protein
VSNKYVNATREHLLGRLPVLSKNTQGVFLGEIYFSIHDFESKLDLTIKRFLAENQILFLEEGVATVTILTEPLSDLEKVTVNSFCIEHGYKVVKIDVINQKGGYIGSDGGGHYSVDYYEFITYSAVTIVSA